MRYELSDKEWSIIRTMLPTKPHVRATASRGSSTRSSTARALPLATTSSRPITWHSSSRHQSGSGCALMSSRPDRGRSLSSCLAALRRASSSCTDYLQTSCILDGSPQERLGEANCTTCASTHPLKASVSHKLGDPDPPRQTLNVQLTRSTPNPVATVPTRTRTP